MFVVHLASALLTLVLSHTWGSTKEARAEPCGLALVLAIDVSGSVDAREYALQTEGLANALRSNEVASALASAGPGTVYITAMHWSGRNQQVQIVPWTQLTDRESVLAFAGQIARFPRQFDKFSTAIGEALMFANAQFLTLPAICRRLVIDVSGDGRNNEGWSPYLIRDRLIARGITINALAILARDPELMTYFQEKIIGGAGSFVIQADRFADYYEAIKKKLVREILPPVAINPAPLPANGMRLN